MDLGDTPESTYPWDCDIGIHPQPPTTLSCPLLSCLISSKCNQAISAEMMATYVERTNIPDHVRDLIVDWARRLQGHAPLRPRPMARDPSIFQDSATRTVGLVGIRIILRTPSLMHIRCYFVHYVDCIFGLYLCLHITIVF
ncbi:hypothetical protein V2J09_017013 [Rumex salicifolius]